MSSNPGSTGRQTDNLEKPRGLQLNLSGLGSPLPSADLRPRASELVTKASRANGVRHVLITDLKGDRIAASPDLPAEIAGLSALVLTHAAAVSSALASPAPTSLELVSRAGEMLVAYHLDSGFLFLALEPGTQPDGLSTQLQSLLEEEPV